MKLIEKLSDLIDNAVYLEAKIKSKNKAEREMAVQLIEKGICFVRYKVNRRTIFAPSRFIGYKNNTLQRHQHSISKHGSTTNNRIKRILNKRASADRAMEKEFREFCKNINISVKPFGSFGIVRKFWNIDNLHTNIYGDVELPEGERKLVTHYRRERNPRIRQIAINNFLANNKTLFCEACEFDFEKKYGRHGRGFIECHHTIPVSKMKKNHRTKPQDIMLLCSNCHRIVHKSSKWLTLKELKGIIKKGK